MSRKPAFTLVELLVVISIIAVLIALLLPGLGRAKRAAQLIQCASNERQLAIGVHAYANDHDELFPCYDTPAALPFPNAVGSIAFTILWTRFEVFPVPQRPVLIGGSSPDQLTKRRRLYEYVTTDIVSCPLDVPGAEPSRRIYPSQPDLTAASAWGTSYFYQSGLCPDGQQFYIPILFRTRVSDVQYPSQLVALGDATLYSTDHLEFEHSFQPLGRDGDFPYRWHDPFRYQLNAAFVDGHVKPIEIRDIPEHLVNEEYSLVEPGWAVYDTWGNWIRDGEPYKPRPGR